METSLARTIDNNFDHIRYDAVCKQLLSDKHILAWIIKDHVSECHGMTIEEIIRCIEGDPEASKRAVFPEESNAPMIIGRNTVDFSSFEGIVTYDLLFTVTIPSNEKPVHLIIDIEAQSEFSPGYPLTKRAAYYCARMLSSQKGREFTGMNYGDLKKVYSIFICTDPPQYRMNSVYGYVTVPVISKGHEPSEEYDTQSISFILLGNEEDEEAPSALRLLNVLLTSEKGAKERKRILEEEFGVPMTVRMESEVNEMSDLWRGVENRGIRKGRAEGLAEGRAEGLATGRAEGRAEEKLNAIKSLMKKLNFTMEQAMNALDMPESEQERYARLLNQ